MKNWKGSSETFLGKKNDVGKVRTVGMRKAQLCNCAASPASWTTELVFGRQEDGGNGRGSDSNRPRRAIIILLRIANLIKLISAIIPSIEKRQKQVCLFFLNMYYNTRTPLDNVITTDKGLLTCIHRRGFSERFFLNFELCFCF